MITIMDRINSRPKPNSCGKEEGCDRLEADWILMHNHIIALEAEIKLLRLPGALQLSSDEYGSQLNLLIKEACERK